MFASADWDTPYWTNKQHIACRLAARGFRVVYFESVGIRPPRANGNDIARIVRRVKTALRMPKQRVENVWVVSPIQVPFYHGSSLIRRINRLFLKGAIRVAAKIANLNRPIVWVYHPYVLDAANEISRRALVYHCVDDLAAIPGVDTDYFKEREERLISESDVVFATSRALERRCRRYNNNTYFHPNVVDLRHFAPQTAGRSRDRRPPKDLTSVPGPRIVYVGVLSDFKVDFELLEELARDHPEWSVVLIGEEREGQRDIVLQRLRRMKNVHCIGRKSYQELPSYLSWMDVGILPTRLNDYTRAMFPMKYFEYIAAGLRVVSTPLDFTREYRGGLEVANAQGEFARLVQVQLNRGRLARKEIQAIVGKNTWESRLDDMMEIVYRECPGYSEGKLGS